MAFCYTPTRRDAAIGQLRAERVLRPLVGMERVWQALTQRFEDLQAGVAAMVPNLVAALVVLLATWLCARLLRKTAGKALVGRVQRHSLVDLVRTLVFIGVWLVGGAMAALLAFPSLTLGGLMGVVGLGSVAMGFAFKDIFENFFAGILILWRFPFDNDDVIECEGIRGRVEEITVRMTLIRKLDGVLVAMPNAVLFKNPVTVLTAQDRRRVSVVCSVAYGEDVDRARAVIREAVAGCERVDVERGIDVLASEFSRSSIDFLVRWWTDPVPGDEHRSRDQVVAHIKRELEANGIEIPLPQRVVTFREQGPDRPEAIQPSAPSSTELSCGSV